MKFRLRQFLSDWSQAFASGRASGHTIEVEAIPPMPERPEEYWVTFLVALVLWREARGETAETRRAVACSIRNRVLKPGWWGRNYIEVVTHPAQYSSMPWMSGRVCIGSVNAASWPQPAKPGWAVFMECYHIADHVIRGETHDTVNGATHYFDKSRDDDPPGWTKAAGSHFVKSVGPFRFWTAK